MTFHYTPQSNEVGEAYWTERLYRRGFRFGEGWDIAGADVPEPYRKAAKDAYDRGCGDYADSLDKYPLDYERYGHVASWRSEDYAGLTFENEEGGKLYGISET